MENVGDRIKAFRESRSLTQKDIFQATGGEIKQTSLSAIENNQAKPGFDTLTALLNAYPELSSDWLIRGEGPMYKAGRELTPAGQLPPAVPSEAKPARVGFPATPGTATPQEADFVGRYITQLEAENARKDGLIEWLQTQYEALLGKSQASPEAAGYMYPLPSEISLRPTACFAEAKVVPMWPAPSPLEVAA